MADPAIEKKVNARDYSSAVVVDFLKRLGKKWNLIENMELLDDLKTALMQSLCPYYVTSEHPDNIDWSKKKKKRDPNDKKPMGGYNKFMKLHSLDEEVFKLGRENRMKAIALLWNKSEKEKMPIYAIDELEEDLIGRLDILKEKQLINDEVYDKKIKEIRNDMQIQRTLENQVRIKKEEQEREKKSTENMFNVISEEKQIKNDVPTKNELEKIPDQEPEPEPEPELKSKQEIKEKTEVELEEIKPVITQTRSKRKPKQIKK